MKCFTGDQTPAVGSVRRIPWVRSLSMASGGSRSDLDSDPGVPDKILARQPSGGLRVFGFAELRAATKGFSRALVLGEGGFGRVYRGVVGVGDVTLDVAVKQLNRNGFQGHKEWINEVKFLDVIKHPNLVKLIGYCAEDDERGIQRLLVYELMPNKSLEDHLFSRVKTPLSWELRLRIALDAARGLSYLHEEMEFQLIFRDFKTANILLDENFHAKLSDFGLARQGPADGLGHVSTSVVGTVGYAAPEYIQNGRLTAKSDVWSFGIVLYELITGRRAVDRNLPKDEQKLFDWARPYSSDPKKMSMIVDRLLVGQYSLKSAQRFFLLANKCLMKQPKCRPKMSEVAEMLIEITEMTEANPDSIDRAHSVRCINAENTYESKEVSSFRRAFNIKELVNLRNRSLRMLDWRTTSPCLPKTWE